MAALNKKANVTWRSFCEGKEEEISKSWDVDGWPTYHLIDHKGIIRHKDISGDEIDKLVGELVSEALKDQGRAVTGLSIRPGL